MKQREAARRRCFQACYRRGGRQCPVRKKERMDLLQWHLVFLVGPRVNAILGRCNPKTKKDING
jgi:hypothetical protein